MLRPAWGVAVQLPQGAHSHAQRLLLMSELGGLRCCQTYQGALSGFCSVSEVLLLFALHDVWPGLREGVSDPVT